MKDEEAQRFEAIETQLSHQELLLEQLNDAVTRQQDSLLKLQIRCDELLARIAALSEAAPERPAEDERPPHY